MWKRALSKVAPRGSDEGTEGAATPPRGVRGRLRSDPTLEAERMAFYLRSAAAARRASSSSEESGTAADDEEGGAGDATVGIGVENVPSSSGRGGRTSGTWGALRGIAAITGLAKVATDRARVIESMGQERHYEPPVVEEAEIHGQSRRASTRVVDEETGEVTFKPLDFWTSTDEEMEELGIGTVLYFTQLRQLGFLFLVLALFLLPALVVEAFASVQVYAGSSISTFENLNRITLGMLMSSTVQDGSAAPAILDIAGLAVETRFLVPILSGLNILAILVFIGGLAYMRSSLSALVHDIDFRSTTISDYTVMVSGLPLDAKDPIELEEYFSTLFGEVYDISVAINVEGLISAFKRTHEDQRTLERLQALVDKSKNGVDEVRARDKFLRRLAEDLTELLSTWNDFEVEGTGVCFVTFESEESYLACRQMLENPSIARRVVMKQSQLFRRTHLLNVSRAPEPENVLWENLGYGPYDRLVRRAISIFVLVLMLSTAVLAVSGMASVLAASVPYVDVGKSESAGKLQCGIFLGGSTTLQDACSADPSAPACGEAYATYDTFLNGRVTSTRPVRDPIGFMELFRISSGGLVEYDYPNEQLTGVSCSTVEDASSPNYASDLVQDYIYLGGVPGSAVVSPAYNLSTTDQFSKCAALVCANEYCMHNSGSLDSHVGTFCYDFWYSAALTRAVSFIEPIFVVVLNAVLQVSARLLAEFEKHLTESAHESSVATKIFVSQFINVGLIGIFVNARLSQKLPFKIPGLTDNSVINGGILLSGRYIDFSSGWYRTVAPTTTLNVFLQVMSIIGTQVVIWIFSRLSLDYFSKNAVTQHDLNRLYEGPEFMLAERYGEWLALIWICLVFAGGIPSVMIGLAGFTWAVYFLDRYLLFTFYAKPLLYDAQLAQLALGIVPFGVVLHLAFSSWMYGEVHLDSYVAEDVGVRLGGWTFDPDDPIDVFGHIRRLNSSAFVLVFGIVVIFYALNFAVNLGYSFRSLINSLRGVSEDDLEDEGNADFSIASQSSAFVGSKTYKVLDNFKYNKIFRSKPAGAREKRLNITLSDTLMDRELMEEALDLRK